VPSESERSLCEAKRGVSPLFPPVVIKKNRTLRLSLKVTEVINSAGYFVRLIFHQLHFSLIANFFITFITNAFFMPFPGICFVMKSITVLSLSLEFCH
jgi:hypothetical protein